MSASSSALWAGRPSSPRRASAQARIPPVEVPAIRSNISAVRRPVRRSISASTSAGTRPRIPPPSIESTFMAEAKTREPPDLRSTGFRHCGVTMTNLRKKLLILGTVACVLGTVQTAAAAVQPAGTGEPLYTNSAQNTQWFEWPATSGIGSYKVQYSYYENNAPVGDTTVDPSPNGATNQWANWSGVRTLQHGGRYGVCAQGYYGYTSACSVPDG